MSDKKYHCRNCGIEITSEQYSENDGLCDECAFDGEIDDEDSDLILGGGWSRARWSDQIELAN
jgi:hypothetical protein